MEGLGRGAQLSRVVVAGQRFVGTCCFCLRCWGLSSVEQGVGKKGG